jgi:hypothetical protein
MNIAEPPQGIRTTHDISIPGSECLIVAHSLSDVQSLLLVAALRENQYAVPLTHVHEPLEHGFSTRSSFFTPLSRSHVFPGILRNPEDPI